MTPSVRRVLGWLYVIVAVAALSLPLANMRGLLLVEPPLEGAQEEPPLPLPTWASIRSGAFQEGFEAWFNFHLGLRPGLVRLDSSLSWYAFRQTPAVSRVLRGAGDSLFIDEDIRFFNLEHAVPASSYQGRLDELAAVQRALAARGQALVPVIIPSKTSIHWDEVPGRLRAPRPEPRPSDETYRTLRAALDRAGVEYADGRAELERLRAEGARGFPATGRHLSRPGACRIASSIAAVAGHLLGRSVASPACTPPHTVVASWKTEELDLRRLSNLFEQRRAVFVEQEPESDPARATQLPGPVLFVCSSFCYAIKDAWTRAGFGTRAGYWYYYSRLTRPDGSEVTRKLGPSDPEWREVVERSPIIVVDLPEPFLDWFGYGFVDALASAELSPGPAPTRAAAR
jgi:hypothetical protein